MPLIQVLPSSLCNKIAAGEVVERPASVVKELIENSLDAGSTEITIEVLHGGKRLIRVSDNGTGMDREDALLCFQRHATSKISGYDDLFSIKTLGFRGEALPSIASVSRVKLLTGVKDGPGISLELQGGEVRDIRDAPATGTSVEIKDLFFNTPARKKFLKADSTELYHIIDTVTKEALSHHEVGFTLLTDNRETISLPRASGSRERIMQVYGEEFLSGLVEVTAGNNGLKLSAFVSRPGTFRSTKAHQLIFLNKRPIRDQSLSHAVYKAYEGILPADRHPIFILCLDVDPALVDVNVHPTKREVRFEDKEHIYRFVHARLRDAIREEHAGRVGEFMEAPGAGYHAPLQEPWQPGSSRMPPQPGPVVSENLEFSYLPSLPFIYLGDTFIALSGRGGLTVIDHHAAHERVLYERLLNGTASGSRQLLFPRQVRLSSRECRALLEHQDVVRTFGIEIDDFGENTLIVRALPSAIEEADIPGILSDLAVGIAEGKASHRALREDLAAKIACHGSVRGKRILSQEELAVLLADLEKTENPDQCPHGRPTRLFYSLDDLNKLFKRK